MKTATHTIEVIEFTKGSYNQGDNLIYQADGREVVVTGEFYCDRNGLYHHSHIFDDDTEIDFTFGGEE